MNDFKKDLDKNLEILTEELKGIRAGRASAGLVEGLKIDYFGNETPVNQMASVNVLDAKTISISPWNKDDLAKIEKAINESDLNLTPNNNGEAIILNLPPLTEERRLEITKLVKDKAEEAKVSIRKKREKKIDELNEKKKSSEISEDEFFTQKEEIQKIIDEYSKKIDEIKENKEKEITNI
jgi:ribosome recycling factor